MGNCVPKPIISLPSANKLKNPSGHSDRKSSRPAKSSNNNGYRNSVPPTKEDKVAVQEEVYQAAGQIIRPNLKIFSLSELKRATRNFKPDSMLGEGGFGRVFKGWVDEKTLAPSKVSVGIPVAVKKSNPDSEQGLKEWQAEVKFLGKFSHPNLVKLLGYCWEDTEFLLVYEYMQRGSLESHLFSNGSEHLSWETRLKIVIGAARGLAFLHTTEKQVIYRDFKTSNILLDGEFNAKLSDFGLAKLGPIDGDSHISTGIVGTYGYAAPEYMATGHLYVRSDVYGFGVVLLEILTGRRVLDMDRPRGEQKLVDWARPFLPDKNTLKRIMDPNLENRYPLRGAFAAAALVLKCLESDPKNRPSIEQVLKTLEQINTIKMKPKDHKPKDSKGPRKAGNTVNTKPSWQNRYQNHGRGNLLQTK